MLGAKKTVVDIFAFLREWKEIFGAEVDIKQIEKKCILGKLRTSCVRSIVWRILLRCLPRDRTEWLSIVQRSRTKYDKLKAQVVVDRIHMHENITIDLSLFNPLSSWENNPWLEHFEDMKLKDLIKRDVLRTHPDMEFFCDAHIQRIIADILFVYAKHNPQNSYNQGMHEVLAHLIMILYIDTRLFMILVEQSVLNYLSDDDAMVLNVIYNLVYLEHDAFHLFSQLMMTLGNWYGCTDEVDVKKETCMEITIEAFSAVQCSGSSQIGEKISHIMNDILAAVDPELYRHLIHHQILPEAFGVRWIRLLFGREFKLDDVSFLWDTIFACQPLLSLLDFVFVSLLQNIRHLLLRSDFGTCMHYLMHYPQSVDIQAIVQHALFIKSPKKHGIRNSSLIKAHSIGREETVSRYTGTSAENRRTPSASSTNRISGRDYIGNAVLAVKALNNELSRSRNFLLNRASYVRTLPRSKIINQKLAVTAAPRENVNMIESFERNTLLILKQLRHISGELNSMNLNEASRKQLEHELHEVCLNVEQMLCDIASCKQGANFCRLASHDSSEQSSALRKTEQGKMYATAQTSSAKNSSSLSSMKHVVLCAENEMKTLVNVNNWKKFT